jgi:hypothetical protein
MVEIPESSQPSLNNLTLEPLVIRRRNILSTQTVSPLPRVVEEKSSYDVGLYCV